MSLTETDRTSSYGYGYSYGSHHGNDDDDEDNDNDNDGYYGEKEEEESRNAEMKTDTNQGISSQGRMPKKNDPSSSQHLKTIGYLGSIAIAVNSLAGPAILQLPHQYQQSGLIPTTLCLIAVAVLSSLCSLHMANLVSHVPGNAQFTHCVEFSDVFRVFWNQRAYQCTQVLFLLCCVCLNMAAIVDTAEMVDSALGLHQQTIALDVPSMRFQTWHHAPCTRKQVKLGLCDPFVNHNNHNHHYSDKTKKTWQPSIQSNTTTSTIASTTRTTTTAAAAAAAATTTNNNNNEVVVVTTEKEQPTPPEQEQYGNYLLTVGYLVTAALFLPICLMDLKENTAWQIVGLTILVSLSAYYCVNFWSRLPISSSHHANNNGIWTNLAFPSLDHAALLKNVSLWGHDWSNMIGVIMFNYSLVLAIPAWLHDKKPHVSVHKVVIGSTALSTFLYIAVGILAAISIPNVNVNMLSPIVSGAFGTDMQWAGSLFAFFIIGLDIPLFSVLTRYNLTHSGLCSTRTANWLVVWLPWGLSWILYQGDTIGHLLNWGGILLTSTVAFVLPLYLALRIWLRTKPHHYHSTNQQPVVVGSIAVYGRHGCQSRRAQIRALQVLLVVTVLAIVLAIVGQLLAAASLDEAYFNDDTLSSSSDDGSVSNETASSSTIVLIWDQDAAQTATMAMSTAASSSSSSPP